MNDLLLVTVIHSLTDLFEHSENERLIQKLVSPVANDPLQEVSSHAVLHDDHQSVHRGDLYGVQYLDNVDVLHSGLHLDLVKG